MTMEPVFASAFADLGAAHEAVGGLHRDGAHHVVTNRHPLTEYKREAFELFGTLVESVKLEVIKTLTAVEIRTLDESLDGLMSETVLRMLERFCGVDWRALPEARREADVRRHGQHVGVALAHQRGTPLVVTYHPAYLLRDPSKKREVWDDMKKVRDYLDSTARSAT